MHSFRHSDENIQLTVLPYRVLDLNHRFDAIRFKQPLAARFLEFDVHGGGLFIVPLVSVLQHRPSAQMKGAVQGAASWLSWVAIAAAAITQTLLSGPAQLDYGQVFWVCGGISGLAGVFVTWSRPKAVPEMLARWRNR